MKSQGQGHRTKVGERLESQILFASDHTCCICRDRNRDVQIHHIDSNPSNNVFENLAVLCLDCHSRATGQRGLGRAYKPLEVSLYKDAWERHVQESRGLRRPVTEYREELAAQADMTVCEILALPRDDPRGRILLDKLYHLHIFRGDPDLDRTMIQGLQHLAAITGYSGNTLGERLPVSLWEMSADFVGPDMATMDEPSRENILACVQGVAGLLHFNALSGRKDSVLLPATAVLENFADLGDRYADKVIIDGVVSAHEAGLKAGREADPFFLRNQHELLASLSIIRERLEESNGGRWHEEIDRITMVEAQYGLVYVEISSKEGYATLSIAHGPARQTLILPAHPSNSIPEALSFLDPGFAHYCSQWQKYMVEDPEERDARGFFLDGKGAPERIADPANAAKLQEIAWGHMDEPLKKFLGNKPVGALYTDAHSPYLSNLWEVVVPPEELGIEPPPE